MTSCIDVPWKPSRTKQTAAASMICWRRAARCCSETRGIGHIIKRTLVLDEGAGGGAFWQENEHSFLVEVTMLTEAPVAVAPKHEVRRRPDWLRPIGIAAAVVVLQALLVALFAWPALKLAPRDLPVVVGGPPAAAQQV